MADGQGVCPFLADGYLRLGRVGECSLLCEDKPFVVQAAGGEEVHIEHVVTVVSIDEVPILGMVLHTRTYTAPHRLVHL